MTAWSDDEIERLGAAEELRIAGRRSDGSLSAPVTIWAVRAGDDLYLRSVRGPAGGWFKAVRARHEGWISAGGVERDVVVEDVPATDPIQDRIDAAYADKHGRGSPDVLAITNDLARATTLKVRPR